MSITHPSKKARLIRRIIGGSIVVAVAGFVVYNLYASREIETVEQNNTSAVDAPINDDAVQDATISRTGTFSGLNAYSVTGDVKVSGEGSNRRLVFSDNFDASNGPDVLVYLSKSDSGELVDPISLGPLKSFNGEQTYDVPDNIDDYTSVVIWCRAFSVAFGAATLN